MKNRKIFLCFTIALLFPGYFLQAQNQKIESVRAETVFSGIEVSVSKGDLLETENLVLMRKEDSCPAGIDDGEEVYRGNGMIFKDGGVKNGKIYCYGAFINDLSGKKYSFSKSNLVKKENWIGTLISKVTENRNLFYGLLVVFFLSWVNRVTMRKKKDVKILLRI